MPFNPNAIAVYVEQQERERRIESLRLSSLSEEEIQRERLEKVALGDCVRLFIDDEAVETDDELDDLVAEAGFYLACKDMLPLDSHGRPFVRVLRGCQRLFKVNSIEFNDLTRVEKGCVLRQTNAYYRYTMHDTK